MANVRYNMENIGIIMKQQIVRFKLEKGLVTWLLMGGDISEVSFLESEFFADTMMKEIFEAMLEVEEEGEQIGMTSVMQKIRDNRGRTTGPDIAEILHEYSLQDVDGRKLGMQILREYKTAEIQRIGGMIEKNLIDPYQAFELMAELEEKGKEETGSKVGDLIPGVLKITEERVQSVARGEGIPNTINSGIDDLDKVGIFKSGELVAIAARPAMGKTTVCLFIAKNVSQDYPVLYFTQEMTPNRLTELLGAYSGKVDSRKVRQGVTNESEYGKFLKGLGELSKNDLSFHMIGTLSSMISTIKKWRKKTDSSKPAMVIVDYVQQVSNERRGQSREQEISSISRAIQRMAIKMNICMVVVSQLSRSVETRGGDKRPYPSDMRDSGQLEQDPDSILMLYRPIAYDFEIDENGSPTCYRNEKGYIIQSLVELLVRKNRNGPTVTIKNWIDHRYGEIVSDYEKMHGTEPFQANGYEKIILPPSAEVPF